MKEIKNILKEKPPVLKAQYFVYDNDKLIRCDKMDRPDICIYSL